MAGLVVGVDVGGTKALLLASRGVEAVSERRIATGPDFTWAAKLGYVPIQMHGSVQRLDDVAGGAAILKRRGVGCLRRNSATVWPHRANVCSNW